MFSLVISHRLRIKYFPNDLNYVLLTKRTHALLIVFHIIINAFYICIVEVRV